MCPSEILSQLSKDLSSHLKTLYNEGFPPPQILNSLTINNYLIDWFLENEDKVVLARSKAVTPTE